MYIVTSFQRVHCARGKEYNLQWGNLAKTTLLRWPRSMSTVINLLDSLDPWCGVVRIACHLCIFFSQAHNSTLIIRKHHTDPNRGASLKMPDEYFSKLSHSSKNESQRNCHSKEDSKDVWQLDITWLPGYNPGTKKRTLGKH